MEQVTVTYERKLTDNNYGSEGVVFSITADVPSDVDPSEAQVFVSEMLRTARLTVLQALAQSPRSSVSVAACYELRRHGYPLPPRTGIENLEEPEA